MSTNIFPTKTVEGEKKFGSLSYRNDIIDATRPSKFFVGNATEKNAEKYEVYKSYGTDECYLDSLHDTLADAESHCGFMNFGH